MYDENIVTPAVTSEGEKPTDNGKQPKARKPKRSDEEVLTDYYSKISKADEEIASCDSRKKTLMKNKAELMKKAAEKENSEIHRICKEKSIDIKALLEFLKALKDGTTLDMVRNSAQRYFTIRIDNNSSQNTQINGQVHF